MGIEREALESLQGFNNHKKITPKQGPRNQ